MTKVKKAFLFLFILLMVAVSCITVSGKTTSAETLQEDNLRSAEEVAPYGLYTKLTLSLDSANGEVWTTVKNELTILPSTVMVQLELYSSQTYKENYTEMTLVTSDSVSDLDQGKTLTVRCTADGASYWKARAYYKIDSKEWSEAVSNTVFIDSSAGTSQQTEEARDYYVNDFLQADAQAISILVPHYSIYGSEDNYYRVLSTVYASLEIEDLLSIKDIFGEVKLEECADRWSLEGMQYVALFTYPPCAIKMRYGNEPNEKYLHILIYGKSDEASGADLYLQFSDYENGYTSKYFKASITSETKDALIEFAFNSYDNEIVLLENK